LANLEITVQYPGQDLQTILLVPVTVLRSVINPNAIIQPSYPTALAKGTGIESWFETITALSSGSGTLAGLATANGASPLGRSGLFQVSGVLNGWTLIAYTGQSGYGYQESGDFNVSTNAVIWVRFL
jgi:hypothetical protein